MWSIWTFYIFVNLIKGTVYTLALWSLINRNNFVSQCDSSLDINVPTVVRYCGEYVNSDRVTNHLSFVKSSKYYQQTTMVNCCVHWSLPYLPEGGGMGEGVGEGEGERGEGGGGAEGPDKTLQPGAFSAA